MIAAILSRAPACSGVVLLMGAGTPLHHAGFWGLRERGVACPQWHWRAWARVVESGPDGQELAAGAWQRLEALPDPRSPRGRIYPLACLIAIALCAFTAAGNDRLTAVGQWIKRASQQDLARLRAPWDPMAGRYRAPDE